MPWSSRPYGEPLGRSQSVSDLRRLLLSLPRSGSFSLFPAWHRPPVSSGLWQRGPFLLQTVNKAIKTMELTRGSMVKVFNQLEDPKMPTKLQLANLQLAKFQLQQLASSILVGVDLGPKHTLHYLQFLMKIACVNRRFSVFAYGTACDNMFSPTV